MYIDVIDKLEHTMVFMPHQQPQSQLLEKPQLFGRRLLIVVKLGEGRKAAGGQAELSNIVIFFRRSLNAHFSHDSVLSELPTQR